MSFARSAAVIALVVFEVWFGLALYTFLSPYIPFGTLGVLLISIIGIVVLTSYAGVKLGCSR
jgi:hypothetical protein